MLHYELHRRLCHARDWLRESGDTRPSVSDVARRAGIATHHFIRLFRAVFGETPHQFRSLAQIDRAKELLILTDASVTQVCMEVGFSSLGSFSTLFKRRVGMSPTEWQSRHSSAPGQPRAMPAELIPGCFSLMGTIPNGKGNFQEARKNDS
jgi:AraC-like DNA-binding protein